MNTPLKVLLLPTVSKNCKKKNVKLEILIVKAIVKLEQHEFLVPPNFKFLWLACFTR